VPHRSRPPCGQCLYTWSSHEATIYGDACGVKPLIGEERPSCRHGEWRRAPPREPPNSEMELGMNLSASPGGRRRAARRCASARRTKTSRSLLAAGGMVIWWPGSAPAAYGWRTSFGSWARRSRGPRRVRYAIAQGGPPSELQILGICRGARRSLSGAAATLHQHLTGCRWEG